MDVMEERIVNGLDIQKNEKELFFTKKNNKWKKKI